MIRATLKDCVDLFNSNVVMQTTAIRGMEQLSEWGTAAAYWKKLGDKEKEDACKLLQKAIAIGDCYRDEVRELIEWVDKTVEDNIMTKEEAVKVIYPKMSAIHDKYYKNSTVSFF